MAAGIWLDAKEADAMPEDMVLDAAPPPAFVPDGSGTPRTPVEAELDEEILAFLRDELPLDPKDDFPIDIWYRQTYLSRGHGFAPYGYVIADFLEYKRDRFDRITEIGAGFGQNCIYFASRGWDSIALDAERRQAALMNRLLDRVTTRHPDIGGRVKIVAPHRYPDRAEEYLDERTVAVFSSLRQGYDRETERTAIERLRLAGGLLFDAHVFFARRDKPEQDELLRVIEGLGFATPALVWDWPGQPGFYQHHRFVYFERAEARVDAMREPVPAITPIDHGVLEAKAADAIPAGHNHPPVPDAVKMQLSQERWERRWDIIPEVIDEMRRLPLNDSGRYRPNPNEVSVRGYPFPYVAALSVNNDCDLMSRDAFEDWHGFVNGSGPTAYGDGLGLEIGDSCWIWGNRESFPSLHRHHPQTRPRVDSNDIERFVELGRLGWLDTMHSLTGFDSPAPPLRGLPGPEHANPPHLRVLRDDVLYALDRLDGFGIKPNLYVNHSCAITNVAAEWPWLQYADEPWHESYCLDLLKQFGFRFFWHDVAVDNDRSLAQLKFGDYLDYASPFYLRLAAVAFDWERWLMSRMRDEAGGMIGAVVALPDDEQERRTRLVGFFNRTFFKARAADDTDIFIFKRFNGVDTPSSSNFAAQVTTSRLDNLERAGGAVVVYNHFGSWSLLGRGRRRRDEGRISVPPVLDVHAVSCWREIAERHQAGRLFVATTGRLLEYLWLRERLQISVEKSAEIWVVTLRGVDCDVLGWHEIGDAHLNGLSLLIPETAPEVTVVVAGRQAPLALTRTPDPTYPGCHALHRPWTALEWPEH
jgi:hypothetical protein